MRRYISQQTFHSNLNLQYIFHRPWLGPHGHHPTPAASFSLPSYIYNWLINYLNQRFQPCGPARAFCASCEAFSKSWQFIVFFFSRHRCNCNVCAILTIRNADFTYLFVLFLLIVVFNADFCAFYSKVVELILNNKVEFAAFL